MTLTQRWRVRAPRPSLFRRELSAIVPAENLQSRFVFDTERSGPVTRAWFLKMVRRTGELAKLPFPIHPHMLRHACGFKLANDGVDTRALQHFLGTQHHAHGAVYRTTLRSFRRVLEGLTPQRIAEQRQRDFQAERPRGGLEVNDELDLGESDTVIVHAPLTESTHHLINREQLALIRPGGIIINVSRGGVVDTAAVIETLRSGIFPLRAWMCWNPSRKCRPNCAHIRSNAHAPCCFHVRHFPAGFAEARG